MTSLEMVTASLGVLGFVISTAHVIWTMRHQLPRLDVTAKSGHIFDAKIHTTNPVCWHEKEREVAIVDVVVGISNCSVRRNSAISMSWHGKEIEALPKDVRYVIGEQTVDISAVMPGETMRNTHYWAPSVQWDDVLPVSLPEGGYFQAHCSGVVTDLQALGNQPKISVAVTDAFGKTYRASVTLNHGTPIDAAKSLRGEPAVASGGACSKKTA